MIPGGVIPPRAQGFTIIEVAIALVVVAVLTAIAIPTWQNHLLRVRRADAADALLSIQSAQDQYFARNARYANDSQLASAPPAGLGLGSTSKRGFYSIEVLTSSDGLSYSATARTVARAAQAPDTRCAEMTIDQVGRRRAHDSAGTDRSEDCWR